MQNIITYIASGVSALVAILTTGIATLTKVHNSLFKKTDTLFERMLQDMVTAEQMYQPMKDKGFDVSAMKKQYVISDLQTYALSNKMTFDKEKWETELETMIKFSNEVNATTTTNGGVI